MSGGAGPGSRPSGESPAGRPRIGVLRPWLVLAICCMSLFIVGMDNTIVNVALPSIQRELGAGVSELQWVVDAYLLVLASLLIFSGSLGDRLGRARVFRYGLALFALASLSCGLAPNTGILVLCRALQGVGGSMLNPVALSIIRETFEDPRRRAQAIGVWGGVIGISMGVGPVLGGFLVQFVTWRAVFYINVPIALLAIVLTIAFVPDSRARHARRADPVGQMLVFLTLVALTFGVIEAPRLGGASMVILGAFAIALICGVALVRWELRRDEPLIEMRVFRSPDFAAATAIAVLAFYALGAYMFLLTLYLQDTRHYSAVQAGLFLLPNALVMLFAAPLSGRLVGALGPRPSLLIGGISLTLASLMLTRLGVGTGDWWILAAGALMGLGSGSVNAPITNTAVSGLPASQAGVAAAIASASRQVGSVLGVAVAGMLATNTAHALGTDQGAWLTLVGCGIAVVAVTILTVRHRRQ
ncbi:drug resistance transporter, EmrB/QacA subfamily [Propionibacterium cyclohexanicum]|uniref:Drug resistance transporter, EmrB/QacA subfamily n=1 Tax=Propionibacterium cyclohexanicum TaxID=64702 RepID=A0A1H9SBU1_9ACTN|nr:MFS transporter [Propionibacterium cyclohexanicum]SER81833.1 drug resistance transporter, EmrB/QacA subfamily [Propionibacterium cyclohexanicum]